MRISIFILFAAILFSCNTEKKMMGKVDEAINKYPVPTAKKMRAVWPCVITESITTTDSADYKLWKDSLDKVSYFYDELFRNIKPSEIIVDTIISKQECDKLLNDNNLLTKSNWYLRQYVNELTDKIKAPPPTVKETVKEKVLDESISNELRSEIKDLMVVRDNLKKQVSRKSKAIWWLSSGLLMLLIPIVIYLASKFK